MIGNDQGLSFVDAMNERLTRLENEMASTRNEIVHGGDVKFDLLFLQSVVETDFLLSHGLQISDLEAAFKKRYGDPHTYFRKKDIMPSIERLINMRSALLHLNFWKDVKGEDVNKRNKLRESCRSTIGLWLNSSWATPYSDEEAYMARDHICKEYASLVNSIQHAKREGGQK